MQRQGVTHADFAVNHPAGALGRQLTLSAADLMVPIDQCPPLLPDAALADVVDHLTGALAGAAWVQQPDQPNRLLGLITDGDLRRHMSPVVARELLQVPLQRLGRVQQRLLSLPVHVLKRPQPHIATPVRE